MSFFDISYGIWVAAAVAVVVAIKFLRKSPPKPSVAELRRKYGQLDFGVKVPKGTKAEGSCTSIRCTDLPAIFVFAYQTYFVRMHSPCHQSPPF